MATKNARTLNGKIISRNEKKTITGGWRGRLYYTCSGDLSCYGNISLCRNYCESEFGMGCYIVNYPCF